jgi:hypothetical protein
MVQQFVDLLSDRLEKNDDIILIADWMGEVHIKLTKV